MSKMNLIAESGAPREALEAWREDVNRCEDAWHAFGREIGARRFYNWPFVPPRSFVFPTGRVPEGWRKPDHRGATTPYKKSTEWLARLDALPAPEDLNAVCRGLGLPTVVEYEEGPNGSRGVRGFHWSASWPANGPVILHCDDFREVAGKLAERHASVRFNAGDGLTIPEGFVEATDAKLDFLHAKAVLEAEEAAAAAAVDDTGPAFG